VKIGVFDSGVGGRSVANAIKKALPNDEVLYCQDRKHVPYGSKTPEVLATLVLPILQRMERDGCDVIVIACNSVTTTLIADLRKKIKVPLVGIEPMVKPAAQLSTNKVITVCATPTTLNSKRYRELKEKYAKNVRVIEPDCSDWAQMIERNEIDQERIKSIVIESLDRGSDVFIMGCTHYHWIEEIVERTAKGGAIVLQPEQAVITQLKRVLARLA
jgi:glutamate racemase